MNTLIGTAKVLAWATFFALVAAAIAVTANVPWVVTAQVVALVVICGYGILTPVIAIFQHRQERSLAAEAKRRTEFEQWATKLRESALPVNLNVATNACANNNHRLAKYGLSDVATPLEVTGGYQRAYVVEAVLKECPKRFKRLPRELAGVPISYRLETPEERKGRITREIRESDKPLPWNYGPNTAPKFFPNGRGTES